MASCDWSWSDLAVPARVQAKMLAEIAILRQRGLW